MKKKIGTTIEDDLHRRIKAAAAEDGITVSRLIERALEHHLNRRRAVRTRSAVKASWGLIPTDRETVEAILNEPSYLDV